MRHLLLLPRDCGRSVLPSSIHTPESTLLEGSALLCTEGMLTPVLLLAGLLRLIFEVLGFAPERKSKASDMSSRHTDGGGSNIDVSRCFGHLSVLI